MSDHEDVRRHTYRSIIAESNLALVVLVWGIALLAFLWFHATGQLAQADIIGKTTMMALRAPALAVAWIIWIWAVQYKVREIASW